MGLPEISILFRSLAQSAIRRSGRGIVACVLEEGEALTPETRVYNGSLADVPFSDYTERNYEYLKLIYEGGPSRVIVLCVPNLAEHLQSALKVLKNLRWNYLTIPALSEESTTLVSGWIKSARTSDHKTFKAVLANCPADHEGIINLTTGNIQSTLGKEPMSATEYTARLAGILAGLPLTRSSTYCQLADIISADTPDDPDTRIDRGELVIIFDGEKFKIGRGVTSLVTFTREQPEDYSKIKIMEGVDLYQDDVRTIFEQQYIGKVINDYDNKQAFVAALRAYQKGLQGDVLDGSAENTASIDLEGQREYLEGRGTDTSEMDDVAIAIANTSAKVFIASSVRFVDAMEDLRLVANM